MALLVFIAVFTYSFVRIIIFEDFEEKADQHLPPIKLSWWLRINYRSQPISIYLVLFILIILSYHTFDYYNLYLEDPLSSSTNRGEMTLSGSVSFLLFPILLSSFTYISHNYHFFKFRRVAPSKNDMTFVHVAELMITGLALFIWVFSMILAL